MPLASFDDFLSSLSDLSGEAPVEDAQARALAEETARGLAALTTIDTESLGRLLAQHPAWVPVLATCVNLSQEQLKNKLRFWFGTSSWLRVARTRAVELVTRLDDQLGLIAKIAEQRAREWSFADLLMERYSWSRSRASGSIGRGRSLEDEVETVITGLGLEASMRGRFLGRSNRSAPYDFAILDPAGQAVIVGSVKGFNSTGSKLSDAVREVIQMAEVRLPRQFVFAVFDGIGWLSRQADLKRIYDLRQTNQIDGLYSLARLDECRVDLEQAARRCGLLL